MEKIKRAGRSTKVIDRSDYVGKRYGSWVVIGVGDVLIGNHWTFRCRCDCGTISVVQAYPLRDGRSTRCVRCAQKATRSIAVGERFNHWVVYELDESGPRVRYRCKCDCGKTAFVASCHLRNGASKGCRACRAEAMLKPPTKRIWCSIMSGARSRGLEIGVTREEAFALLQSQGFTCALSGLPIALASSGKTHRAGGTTASLDRIDSSKGYVTGNIQWVHKTVNDMKGATPEHEFVAFCRAVAAHHTGI